MDRQTPFIPKLSNPSVLERGEFMFPDSGVKRIELLWPHATKLFKNIPMNFYQSLLECFQRQNVKPVLAISRQSEHYADNVIRESYGTTNNLLFPIKSNINKLADIKLPSGAICRLNLHWH